MGVLMFAAAAAVDAPIARPPDAPDPEFLEFLGETAGVNPELVAFMASREAKRAMRDAAKKAPKEEAQAARASGPDGTPLDRGRFIADGTGRWQSMNDTDRAAARARFDTWRQLPPRDREQLRERWKLFRELTPGQQEALREAYLEFLKLPPERRAALVDRWQQQSPEEWRRTIQRRQGTKPGTVDKRPCPPC